MLSSSHSHPLKLCVFLTLTVLTCQISLAHPGDPDSGKKIYARCMGCHSLERNRTGPKHCGLLGRKAGSINGYKYSSAMKDSGITWNAETLNRFLQGPAKLVPGTNMGLAGIKNSQTRRDLIAYLSRASKSEQCNSKGADDD